MEIPHPEHNSRNSVRRLTCTKLKCYTTLIRRETLVPQKEASHHAEPKSGKPINVVHVSSTFAPSLTTAIIFRRLGSHDRYRKRGLHLPIDEKKNWSRFRFFSQKKCMQGGNISAFRPQSD